MTRYTSHLYCVFLCLFSHPARAFLGFHPLERVQRAATNSFADDRLLWPSCTALRGSFDSNDNRLKGPLSSLVTARLPTSVEDQVRQCVQSIREASSFKNDSSLSDSDSQVVVRHVIRLLLPVIGATDLDDWPGGARQMMEAAVPLLDRIIAGLMMYDSTTTTAAARGATTTTNNNVQKVCLDPSDGVYAWYAQAAQAKNDCVFVLLPTAECVRAIQGLEEQLGPKRNLVLINPQWRRRSDFGGFLGVDEKSASYVEQVFQPTFSLTNFICEGESIRVLHTHGSNWRVFVRKELDNGDIDWKQVGQKPFSSKKPSNWQQLPGNNRDGGRLFDYGQPSYQEIIEMLKSSSDYTPKNPAERAAAAFDFIKDTL